MFSMRDDVQAPVTSARARIASGYSPSKPVEWENADSMLQGGSTGYLTRNADGMAPLDRSVADLESDRALKEYRCL